MKEKIYNFFFEEDEKEIAGYYEALGILATISIVIMLVVIC